MIHPHRTQLFETVASLERQRWLRPVSLIGAIAIALTGVVTLEDNTYSSSHERSVAKHDHHAENTFRESRRIVAEKIHTKVVPAPRPKSLPRPPKATHNAHPANPAAIPRLKPAPQPAPSPKPHERVSYSALRRSSEVTPMSPKTEARIEAMNLTLDGYQNFLKSINTTFLHYSQQFPPFNPDKVAIRQGKSEFFSWHFTALYMNADGISHTEAKGDMDVAGLIRSMAGRSDVCCGINWIMDRYGNVNQTAPLNAKLRHNPPYDGITTGVEFEALTQDGITTKQYENGAYLTIAVLNQQGLLGLPPKQSMHGHGEDRDGWRAKWLQEHNTKPKWDMRNDFDKPVSEFYRERIALFLDRNPTIGDIEVNF